MPKRPPGVKGLVWDASTGEASHTVGGERGRLSKIVDKNIRGELLGIDQIGPSSINVAVIVDREEFFRLQEHPDRFSIDYCLPVTRKK